MSTKPDIISTLQEYNQWQKDSDITLRTRENHQYWLEQLAEHTNKSFNQMTVANIVDFLRFKKDTTKAGTRNIIRSVFRVFFRDFLEKPDTLDHPIMQREKVRRKEERPLTEEEEEQLIASTQKVRDRALIAVMIEGGLRRGVFAKWKSETYELKSGPPYLQYGDVRRDKDFPNGFVIRVRKSKTRKEWDSPIYRYAWALKLWLAHHPTKQPSDPLFCYQRQGEVFPLSEMAIYRLVKSLVQRAGLDSNIHPHLLRKRAATKKKEMGMDDFDIAQTSGWKEGSKTLYRYLQQNPVVARQKYAAAIGMKPKEESKETKEKDCLSCGERLVNPDSSICPNCWLPVDKTAAEILVTAAREGRKADAKYREEMEALGSMVIQQQERIKELEAKLPKGYDHPDVEEAERVVDEVLRLLLENPDVLRELKQRQLKEKREQSKS